MCNLNKRTDNQTGGSPEDTQNSNQSPSSSYGEGMTIKGTNIMFCKTHYFKCPLIEGKKNRLFMFVFWRQKENDLRQCNC